MLNLVVFDLDGTLVDSSADLANATNALIEELGGQPLERQAIIEMVGEGAGVLVRRALKATSLRAAPAGALERFLALYSVRLLENTRPYAGMTDTLDALAAAGRPMAVLTNKPQAASEAVLDGLGLRRYFGSVVGGDTPAGRKPNPAGLLGLVQAHGATPATTILVGDSPVNLETTRRAGTHACLARYGFGYRFGADAFRGDERFIDTPADLLRIL